MSAERSKLEAFDQVAFADLVCKILHEVYADPAGRKEFRRIAKQEGVPVESLAAAAIATNLREQLEPSLLPLIKSATYFHFLILKALNEGWDMRELLRSEPPETMLATEDTLVAWRNRYNLDIEDMLNDIFDEESGELE